MDETVTPLRGRCRLARPGAIEPTIKQPCGAPSAYFLMKFHRESTAAGQAWEMKLAMVITVVAVKGPSTRIVGFEVDIDRRQRWQQDGVFAPPGPLAPIARGHRTRDSKFGCHAGVSFHVPPTADCGRKSQKRYRSKPGKPGWS